MRYIWIILILIIVNPAFAGDINIVPLRELPENTNGAYRLILYGGNYLGDLESLAILDLEGDGFTIEPYAPEFSYTTKSSLSLKDSVHYGVSFISDHPSFLRYTVKRILDNNGNTLGYELRPLYYPLRFGVMDVLELYYWREDNRVLINIELKPAVRRQIENEGDDGWIWGD